LEKISNTFNYAIYFSTHSIELISGIKPDNIFFIERYADDTMEVINPCYPAYATRILIDHHAGYDYVILVEDDLAKSIITRLLKKNHLFTNKLIHVLPAGGFSNVIDLAHEVVTSNLTGANSKIIIILDGDVKDKADKYFAKMHHQNNIPLNYLPIESLEKYLKNKLLDNVDRKLYRILNDFVFQQRSLNSIIQEYQNLNIKDDNSGKRFYILIDNELRARNKSREEIVEMVVDYLFENNNPNLAKITHFLKNQLQ